MHTNRSMNNLKKVVLFSCFFVLVNYVFSQNTGSFKYFITSYDSSYALNVDVLEINDRYYLLTSGTSLYSTSNAPTVTIFDKSLNQIEQIQLQLPEEDTELKLNKFFYADNHFYVFGLH